jgi:hypothetical protein
MMQYLRIRKAVCRWQVVKKPFKSNQLILHPVFTGPIFEAFMIRSTDTLSILVLRQPPDLV